MCRKSFSELAVMKLLALLILTFSVVLAQEIVLPIETIRCCTTAEVKSALIKLYAWIPEPPDCDPLFLCIRKCLNINIGVTVICLPNAAVHVSFNMWLLNNYYCLPNTLLQCLKGCIRYNSYPPCPTISTNISIANPIY
ncbi:hypothetical protein FQR65_LT00867 [Abscondita terminalis]|nr:hypothetical protein FQR65_LT00867 [Abscondita terminalis]